MERLVLNVHDGMKLRLKRIALERGISVSALVTPWILQRMLIEDLPQPVPLAADHRLRELSKEEQ